MSDKWFARLDGTCLDQLPDTILALGPKTHFLDFDARALGGMFDHELTEAKRLCGEADKLIGWEEHFFKLSTRSAKDAFGNGGVTPSAKQAIYWMSCSMRIMDDLCELSWLEGYQAKLCIREPFWGLEGQGTWEFRCFVKNGDLIAVTDYDYTKPNAAMRSDDARAKIYSEIVSFFKSKVQPEMGLPDYVFDLARTSGGWVLIEVNPYGLSDPCFLKNYAGVEAFDGDIAHRTTEPTQ